MENKADVLKIKEIENLLDERIHPEQLAQVFRRLSQEVNRMYMDFDEGKVTMFEKDWIVQGNYWLNEISEILSPNLKKEL